MITLLLRLLRLLPFLCGGHRQLALENLALRSNWPSTSGRRTGRSFNGPIGSAPLGLVVQGVARLQDHRARPRVWSIL
jgi:hypothetical protein